MMPKVITWIEGGQRRVNVPVESAKRLTETGAEFLQRMAALVVPNGTAFQVVDAGDPLLADPPASEPIPMVISDRQFFQALAIAGLITKDEALAAVMTGALPAALETFVDVMTPAEQFAARMKLSGATTFRRDDELVSVIGALQGMTEDEIDNLWRAAAVL